MSEARGILVRMAITVRPATDFEGVRTMVGPKNPESNVCWCLSYRIPSKLNGGSEVPTAART